MSFGFAVCRFLTWGFSQAAGFHREQHPHLSDHSPLRAERLLKYATGFVSGGGSANGLAGEPVVGSLGITVNQSGKI